MENLLQDMKWTSAGNLKSVGIYWRRPRLMLMAERFFPLPPLLVPPPLLVLLSSSQAFQACLNKACLPGRGLIPLWPFALWPKVHSVCKVRNSSEVQFNGGEGFSSSGVCTRLAGAEKQAGCTPCELWMRLVVWGSMSWSVGKLLW